MYNNLRLASGGGLNSFMDQVAQAENTVTIAIGIGGTGFDALRTFKKMVFERVKQDNYDKRESEAPVYRKIRFLGIDTDSVNFRSANSAEDFSRDFFDIGSSTLATELADKAMKKSSPWLDWLNDSIDANVISHGAGGIRQAGRYCLFRKASELKERIKAMITHATVGLGAKPTVNIYIMAGLGGGIGSGCFIDVCYIINDVLRELQLLTSANTVGFFFLPDVNLSKPSFPLGGVEEEQVRINSYAALKELDYLMGIPQNGDRFTQQYSSTYTVDLDVPPVVICHLLSAKNIDGTVLDDGYSHVMHVVAEYALLFLIDRDYDYDSPEDSGTLVCMRACLEASLSCCTKKYGSLYKYHAIGASCAKVPYREIGTYLAAKSFDTMQYIRNCEPTKEDMEDFCRRVGLSFDEINQAVDRGVFQFNLNANDYTDEDIQGFAIGTIGKPLARAFEAWSNHEEAKRMTNITTLKRPLATYDVSAAPDNIIGRIYKELIAVACDPNRGPYFAARMLRNANNHTIDSVLDGIRKEAEARRDYAMGQVDFRTEQLNHAQSAYNAARILTRGRRERYVNEVKLYYENELEIQKYNAFMAMIDAVKQHLDALEAEFFRKYTGIMDNLFETFEDNAQYLRLHGDGKKMYTWSIIDIESIRGELDAAVAEFVRMNENGEPIAEALVEKFNAMMLDNIPMWIDEKEIKITEMISNFISEVFHLQMERDMPYYLQQKFGAEGHDLVVAISEHIIYEGLAKNATPLFSADLSVFPYYDIRSHHPYKFLFFPTKEDLIRMAVKEGKWRNLQINDCRTALKDRIFMLEFFSGFPLYAYAELIPCEQAYYARLGKAGKHLYEGGEKNWRKMLPSPIPKSFVSDTYHRPEEEQQRLEEVEALYQRAKEAGIIEENGVTAELLINVYRMPDYEAILAEGWNTTYANAKAALKALEEAKDNLQAESTYHIWGVQDFERKHLDMLARMPVYVAIMAEELKKLEQLYQKINEIGRIIVLGTG